MTQFERNVDDKSKSMSKSFYSVILMRKLFSGNWYVKLFTDNNSVFSLYKFFIQSKIDVLEKFESNTKGKLTTTMYLTRDSFPHGLNVY